MTAACIFEADGLLLALPPALGARTAPYAPRGVLKWAGPHTLTVARSVLEFRDDTGRLIAQREDAFGLLPGTAIAAPASRFLGDDRDLPQAAATQCWRLNDCTMTAPARAQDAAVLAGLDLLCLPLMLPLAEDDHLIASLVNQGGTSLDIAAGVRSAVCWVDGTPWPSARGGHWDGAYLLRPGQASTRRFRLADFPGVPMTGAHEVALEMLGRRSAVQRVQWHGEPWRPGGAA